MLRALKPYVKDRCCECGNLQGFKPRVTHITALGKCLTLGPVLLRGSDVSGSGQGTAAGTADSSRDRGQQPLSKTPQAVPMEMKSGRHVGKTAGRRGPCAQRDR